MSCEWHDSSWYLHRHREKYWLQYEFFPLANEMQKPYDHVSTLNWFVGLLEQLVLSWSLLGVRSHLFTCIMTAAHMERSLCSWVGYACLIWWVLGILWETWPTGGGNLLFGSSVSCPEDIGEVSVPGEHKPMLHEKQWSPWEPNCHLSHEDWACSAGSRWAVCWSGVNNPCRACCSGPQEKTE